MSDFTRALFGSEFLNSNSANAPTSPTKNTNANIVQTSDAFKNLKARKKMQQEAYGIKSPTKCVDSTQHEVQRIKSSTKDAVDLRASFGSNVAH